MLKLAYFLRKIQTSLINNLRILRIKNAKFPGFQGIVFVRIRTYSETFFLDYFLERVISFVYVKIAIDH